MASIPAAPAIALEAIKIDLSWTLPEAIMLPPDFCKSFPHLEENRFAQANRSTGHTLDR
ncbi:MAG: hypothetical protein ACKO2Z_27390 [Sphaerospermopsis kisseleviana]